MKRLVTLIVVLAAFGTLPAAADAHTMRCGDAFWALGRTPRGNANTAWHGCRGVGGSWLTLIVLGNSGRVYVLKVHHYHSNCGAWGCRQHYTFY